MDNKGRLWSFTSSAVAYLATASVLAFLVSPALGQTPATPLPPRIDLETGNLDILHAIVKLAADNSVPLGVVGFRSEVLCRQPIRTAYKSVLMPEIFADLLVGTGWTSVYERGVVQIRPNLVPEAAKSLLSMKFDDFSAPSTTPQGVGIILSGYISSRIYPGKGYAGNIMENPTAEHVPAFHLRNVSVEEILNYIASKGKGLWTLAPTSERGAQAVTLQDLRVSVYAYKDDAHFIEQLSCGQSTH